MAILGQLIKSAIELKHALNLQIKDVPTIQEQQLTSLLQQAKNTSFGLYYDFEKILRSKDPIEAYQKSVPIFDYHTMHEKWWYRQQTQPNITWPGIPDYFALSSGTTGNTSKRIPVTDEMLASFRAVGISQAESLANFNLPKELFEKEVLILSSSASLEKRGQHLEGEISGINSSNLPTWFGGFYKPGEDIAQIDDWDERVARIVEEAPNWNIVAIAGIPSWVKMMIEKIIEQHQLNTIHDIWPHLSIYVSGGVAFEPHRKSLEKLLKKPLIYMDTYLASEGFIGYTDRPGTMDMKLAFNHSIFYEFIPFDERGFDEFGNLLDDPEVLDISKVEEGQDYALLLSSPAGAWRYFIGDTIKFTDLKRLEMKISGRTKYYLNTVGSQLSEEKINEAMEELASEMDLTLNEFAVAALKREDGEFIHQWILGVEEPVDNENVAQKLDDILQNKNKNYRVARQKALYEVRVECISSQKIYDWLEARKKKGGQIKVPKVMKPEMMEDVLSYISQ